MYLYVILYWWCMWYLRMRLNMKNCINCVAAEIYICIYFLEKIVIGFYTRQYRFVRFRTSNISATTDWSSICFRRIKHTGLNILLGINFIKFRKRVKPRIGRMGAVFLNIHTSADWSLITILNIHLTGMDWYISFVSQRLYRRRICEAITFIHFVAFF